MSPGTTHGSWAALAGPAGPRAVAATHPAAASAKASDELRYRRRDHIGDPTGAFNLGVLLYERGDVAGAMAAYGRAEKRGDRDAAFNLGVLLYETGDLSGAEAAWQRGVKRGDMRAAANLVFLAPRRHPEGEPKGVVHAGGAREAFNLGVVLHQQGDLTGAKEAYRRAEQWGDPDAAFNLGVLLYEAGDLDGAEASWRRSVHRGNPRARENLKFLARRRACRDDVRTCRAGVSHVDDHASSTHARVEPI